MVAFDRTAYDNLRSFIGDIAETTQDGLWDKAGYSIGAALHGQPANTTWNPAAQVGSSINKLATQVRAYTDTICGKSLPEYADMIAKAAETLEETDETASDDANGTGS